MKNTSLNVHRSSQPGSLAAEDLMTQVYEDLRRLAASRMSRLTPGQTLQPTALVHEAWLRLAGADQRNWQNRSHFFAAAAEAMRRVIVDYIRGKARLKRGAGWEKLDIP